MVYYLFLDESGNFDFSKKGSKVLVLTCVAMLRPFKFVESLSNLKYDYNEQGIEIKRFHASEDKQEVRNGVFEVIKKHIRELRVDTLIVEKSKTVPEWQNIETVYPEMFGYLLRYVCRGLARRCDEFIIFTDSIPVKNKRKAIQKAIKLSIKIESVAHKPYSIYHHESMAHYGLQIVDYCSWAIYWRWNNSDRRSYNIIKPAITSEFDIFASGTNRFY